jgi:Ca-activated chloride channel family protein
MFNPRAFWNTRPDGFPVLEIADESPEGPRRFVPLKKTHLSGSVTGPLGALKLTQTFGYSREQCDKVLEAIYRFPLPGDAAVTGVTVRFGNVEICATLKAREEAEADYEAAKQEGRQAALATRESPDVFTLSVAGIQPDQDVTVETAYVQLAREESGARWSLRIPLTTSPRYVRGDETGSPHASGQPLLLLRDPGHRFSMDLRFDGVAYLSSATHELEITDAEGGQRVRLKGGEVLPDRDCVISYHAADEDERRPALRTVVHQDTDTPGASTYFLAQVAPPKSRKDGEPPIPREVILLVDHSGSMEGPKWEASDWAVTRFLSTLNERDTFALGLFHNATKWMHKEPRAGDSRNVDAAIKFLKANRDSGGTELGVALEQAVHLPASPGEERSRHILIVTDAEVSDAGRLLRLAEDEYAKSPEKRRRISVLCIDASPNSLLASELAERGGGIARFLTSAPDEEDITTALDDVLEEWNEPVLYGMRLRINRRDIAASGQTVANVTADGDESVIDLGDLPGGRARWVAGRIPSGDGDLTLTLTAGYGRREREVGTATISEADREHARRPELKSLFGARRVLSLEYLWTGNYSGSDLEDRLRRLGYDPKEALSSGVGSRLYAENQQAETGDALKRLLTSEALEYGLASARTAFIAVRTEAGKPVEATIPVANALPSGWSQDFETMVGAAPGGGAFYAAFAPPPSMAPPIMPSPASPRSAKMRAPAGGGLLRRIANAFQGTADSAGSSMQARASVSPEPAAEEMEADIPAFLRQRPDSTPLVSAIPAFTGDTAVLYEGRLSQTSLSRLTVRFPDGEPASLDDDLVLLLYVDDPATPRARVRLSDLLRQGGERPLNISLRVGAAVRLALHDPNGAWKTNAPRIEIVLA